MPSLDPFGVVARTASVVGWTERQVMRTLHWRLDNAAPSRPVLERTNPAPAAELDHGRLPDQMHRLLDRALEQTAAASRQDLFEALLGQLVPDEARILAALSDGSTSPVLHVYEWSRAGIRGQPVLENASLVGRTANVSLPHLTPVYVSHLLALGLVAIGPEDPELKTEYEILMADDAVRAAIKDASRGPIAPRVARQALRMSPLGAELWAACDPAGPTPGPTA